jgi:kynurenine 3-monooxygenase
MLDELESLPNVKFFFNHKLTGADFRKNKAWFEVHSNESLAPGASPRDQEVEISFDLLIGADGAHSAARFHLMKYTRMNYQQEYIDTLWCEFTIEANETSSDSKFKLSPHHLHIWPGRDFMFIAIPSTDGSFTCTLFMPAAHFAALEASPDTLPDFFDTYFPRVTNLISPSALIASFMQNPHLPLISIKCSPYHFGSSAIIVGDAAHAMVPFYGQGMNAGLEDVFVLFSILDKYSFSERAEALAEYSALRGPDAHAINELALQNYIEMRSSVTSSLYKIRKYLEEALSTHAPSLGWQTKYSRVSFENERYSEVVQKSERQGRLLLIGLMGFLTMPPVVGVLSWWFGLGKPSRALKLWPGLDTWLGKLRR